VSANLVTLSSAMRSVTQAHGKPDAVAAYAAQRAQRLTELVGHPGFQEAVDAEVMNVALMAGIAGSQEADRNFLVAVETALKVAAILL
jgi:hypothetical protein